MDLSGGRNKTAKLEERKLLPRTTEEGRDEYSRVHYAEVVMKPILSPFLLSLPLASITGKVAASLVPQLIPECPMSTFRERMKAELL